MEIKVQLPASISRVVLVGFMGAGKSSVGALLAPRLQWSFLDVDHVLESRMGTSIAEMFATYGEAEFRRLEADLIRELLDEDRLVLALGGGAMESSATRELLLRAPDTCIIFLKAPLEVLISRCEQQPGAAIRPVLNDRERLLTRFESRLPHYESAHMTVETAFLNTEEASQVIFTAVSALLKDNIPA
ncbi:shikimate kinase [Acidobacterium sp. S8]|uniref:shikimate kinase n=1 Tax=Acidobacterium sp. S8 TaxID=1641854 RepID=UPI00131D4FBD|nr:shikimate kinase [Acidobacterium sp. S8]